MEPRTILCVHTLNVGGNVWRDAVRKLSTNVTAFAELMINLDTQVRTIHPTTDASVLLWPTQKYMCTLQGMADMDAAATAKAKGLLYEKCIIKGDMAGLDLTNALDLLECFHVLEALPVN